MAGTCVITRKKTNVGLASNKPNVVEEIKYACTTTSGGLVDKQTDEIVVGRVVGFIANPDGTDAPTDNYDVTITNEDGVDVLGGAGANLDTANSEMMAPMIGNLTSSFTAYGSPFVASKLQVNMSAGGDTKKSVLTLLVSAV